MTSRVSAAFQSALFLLMVGCASQDYSPNRIYGISDAQVYSLGKTLGFDVEARGMSNYFFSNRNKAFGLTAHNDINRLHNGEPVADEPIRIFYQSKQLEIPMAQGLTMKELEDTIRDFIEEK
jgi:hypothetical protein